MIHLRIFTCSTSGEFPLINLLQDSIVVISYSASSFPEALFFGLAKMFNKSKSSYLVSYQKPKLVIDKYKFHVREIGSVQSSMHGSREGHTAYLYERQRQEPNKRSNRFSQFEDMIECDDRFKAAFELCQSESLQGAYERTVVELEKWQGNLSKRLKNPIERFSPATLGGSGYRAKKLK